MTAMTSHRLGTSSDQYEHASFMPSVEAWSDAPLIAGDCRHESVCRQITEQSRSLDRVFGRPPKLREGNATSGWKANRKMTALALRA
jgi:hypothetical protein